MTDVAGYWKRQFEKVSPRSEPPQPIVPRFYGEQHNTRNLSELDALLERHRGRHKPDCARVMVRADIGLPPMPDAFYAMWLGKEGCL